MTLKQTLLALPVRVWDIPSKYDYIHIVPTNKKHDSGWRLFAIVGESKEIASYCDVANWEGLGAFNLDVEYPSNLARFHSYDHSFEVGIALSSTTIRLVPK